MGSDTGTRDNDSREHGTVATSQSPPLPLPVTTMIRGLVWAPVGRVVEMRLNANIEKSSCRTYQCVQPQRIGGSTGTQQRREHGKDSELPPLPIVCNHEDAGGSVMGADR